MNKAGKKSRFAVIIGIIWGIAFAAVIVGVIYIFTGYEVTNYHKPEYIFNEIAYGKYGAAYERVFSEMEYEPDIESREDYTELIAMKDYIEAAGSYVIFLEENDTDRAATAKEKIDNAYSRLGSLSFVKEEIDEIVGLQE